MKDLNRSAPSNLSQLNSLLPNHPQTHARYCNDAAINLFVPT